MKLLLSTLIIFIFSLTSASAQLFNTSLTITVRDNLGNLVSGAEVKLFETEADYLKEENPVAESISDAKGLVKLKKLKAISYHVIVRTKDMDNQNGGEVIGALEEGKFNKVTIVVE